MASKELTAKVRLDASQAHRTLDKLIAKIKQVEAVTNKPSGTSGLDKKIERAVLAQERLKQATLKTQLAEERLATQKHKTALAAQKVTAATEQTANKATTVASKIKEWANNHNKFNSGLKSSNNLLTSIGGKLKALAATYLGVMGMKTAIGAADTITSAQNKLNFINAQQLGAQGTNEDGSYSSATLNATQDSLDQMYRSSQKVRMGYNDMMDNVSKSMVLAGDAFQHSTDNAIRFQEIMAEAYAVGGASAAEMSSSMYQLIQALGAGTLAGDELRSVREGAPLAYKEIEKFVQGVYDTDESLKELASQGKVTSDMVVEAIMKSGDTLDKAFAQTEQTFAQTWTQIKNAALDAFRPIAAELNKMLNDAVDNGLIEKIEVIFSSIANALSWLINVIYDAIVWIADNWYWLKNVIVTALIVLAGYFVWTAMQAVWSAITSAVAWMILHPVLTTIFVAVVALIYVFLMWRDGAISTCEAIVWALAIVAAAILIIGIIIGSTAMVVVALIIALLGLIFVYFAEICGGIVGAWQWTCALVSNIWTWVCSVFNALCAWIGVVWNNFINSIINLFSACSNWLSGAMQNIGIWWDNLCADMTAAFWNFIASCLDGISALAPVIEAVASAFGKEISISGMAGSARAKASAATASKQEYVDLGAAWDAGMNTRSYQSASDAWSSGFGNPSYKNLGDAWSSGYNSGYDWGSGVLDSIDKWGSQFQGYNSQQQGIIDKVLADGSLSYDERNLLKDYGIDPDEVAKKLNGGGNAGSGWTPKNVDELLNGVDGIGGSAGSIADSMELTEDDLKELRALAELEWKKEYTTAQITVDMTNYNHVNNTSDWEGVVTKMVDVMWEELDYKANGVYVTD